MGHSHPEGKVALVRRPRREPGSVLRLCKVDHRRLRAVEPHLPADVVWEPAARPADRKVQNEIERLIERRRGAATGRLPDVVDDDLDRRAIRRLGGVIVSVRRVTVLGAGGARNDSLRRAGELLDDVDTRFAEYSGRTTYIPRTAGQPGKVSVRRGCSRSDVWDG